MDNTLLPVDIQSVSSLFDVGNISLLVLGFFILWCASQLINWLANKLTTYFHAKRFLILQFKTLLSFILYLGGTAFLIYSVIQPPKEVVFAATGSMAVAIGFALKDVVASVIAGIVLLFDNPFKVGDRITFDDTYGEIVSIGLRSVKVKTLDDNIVSIPNARFINDKVSSANFGALDMMVVCDFHVTAEADLELVKSIIREVIVTSRFAYLKKPVTFSMEETVSFSLLIIKVSAKAYVIDTNFEKAFQADVIAKVNKLFTDNHIARPTQGLALARP